MNNNHPRFRMMSRFPSLMRNNILPVVHMRTRVLHQDQLRWSPAPGRFPVWCWSSSRASGSAAARCRLLGPKAAVPSKASSDDINYESRNWVACLYQQNFPSELLPYFMYILWYIIYYMWILMNACGATETCSKYWWPFKAAERQWHCSKPLFATVFFD